jgi:hypothetical protein
MKRAFDDAYEQGEAAVEKRLKTSKVDGKTPLKMLPYLRAEAQNAWGGMIKMFT